MSSRMEKYEFEENSQTPSRTSRNASLYQGEEIEDYNKIDINSNISVLKNDVKNIDVDKIREMLDKKYRDNLPQRKSMDIKLDEEEDEPAKDPTKEYDINDIIAQAKTEQPLDYHEERLRKLRDTNYTILNNLDLDSSKGKVEEIDEDDAEKEATKEKELRDLISTITQLEIKNTQKIKIEEENSEPTNDLLDLTDDTDPSVLPPSVENSFYTGDLKVKEKDFDDDFNEIQNDIKSNSILIKILAFVFIIILFIIGVMVLNNLLEWGLF